jgi:hypothetical protein
LNATQRFAIAVVAPGFVAGMVACSSDARGGGEGIEEGHSSQAASNSTPALKNGTSKGGSPVCHEVDVRKSQGIAALISRGVTDLYKLGDIASTPSQASIDQAATKFIDKYGPVEVLNAPSVQVCATDKAVTSVVNLFAPA